MNKERLVPVDGKGADWPRKVAEAIRYLLGREDALGARIAAIEGGVMTGAGSPEGSVAAPVGTLYRRSDGGSGTTLYVKESGSGASGWAAK